MDEADWRAYLAATLFGIAPDRLGDVPAVQLDWLLLIHQEVQARQSE